MNAIILCGGLSTRLGDITKNIPKVLLDIGGKTVLDWQLEKLKSVGINKVVLASGHLADVLRDTVGDERGGVELVYAIEEKRLGTGGAIAHGFKYIDDMEQPTWVLNGDVLSTVSFAQKLADLDLESEGIILGSRVENASTYGTLLTDENGHLEAFKEKEGKEEPGYINGGVYLFTKHARKYFPEQDVFSIEYDVFPRMKNLFVHKSDAPWIDIGLPDRLIWARDHWQEFV